MKSLFLTPVLSSFATAATVHTIQVGLNGADTFTPATLNPKVGDIIVWQLDSFHNIVEGTFDKPCLPKANGFYSGEYPTTQGGKLRFVTKVTSPDPTYFYCSVGKHCQIGMVGGFNVPSGKGIADYAQRAKGVKEASEPDAIRGGQLLDLTQILKLNSSVADTGIAEGEELDPAFDIDGPNRAASDVAAADAIPPWFPGIPTILNSGSSNGNPGSLPPSISFGGPPPGVSGPPPWLPGPPPGVAGSPPNTWLGSVFPVLGALNANGASVPAEKITKLFSSIHTLLDDFLSSVANNGTVPIRGMARRSVNCN